jgi:hypothetical protein
VTFNQFKDFNYVYLSGRINIDYIPERSVLFSLIKAIGKAFYFSALSVKHLVSNKNVFSSRNKIVFFSISENNFLSLNPIYQQLNKDTVRFFGDRMYNKKTVIFLPTILAALFSIFFFPKVVYNYLMIDSVEKRNFRRGINDIVLTYPFFYITRLWFRIVKPKAIVIANDHVFSTRILVHWANKFNVPSVYIQHAAVTKEFPPLTVTHAFLEGEDSKEKYIQAGSDPSKIELIGIPKLDYLYKKINNSSTVKTIGVAGNGLESKRVVIDLLNFLHENFPHMKVIYRPHRMQYFDAPYKDELSEILDSIPKETTISNPFDEKATDYLAKTDLLIAGDSSIHLEAVLLNVTSVYFFKSGDYFDYYGFIQNKLIAYANDLEELKAIIKREENDRKAVRQKAKRYCYTLGTEHDGKAADLAVKLLKQKVN